MAVVSVVIPTYERDDILPRALDSVLEQTFADLEVLVVDDNSQDDTSEIIDSYSDNRLEYIRHSENLGANAARNTGIRAASGDYIAFLDDDDMWLESKIERQLEEYQSLDSSFGLVYTGRRIIDDETIIEEFIPTKSGDIFRYLLRRNVIPSETPMIRAECFEKVGMFDIEFRSCQDWDMWLRIARSYKVSFVPKILAVSFWSGTDRISLDYGKKCQGYQLLYRKYRSEIHGDRLSTWHFVTRLGYYCLLQNLDVFND